MCGLHGLQLHSWLTWSTVSPPQVPPQTAGGYLLLCGPPWASGGHHVSPWSSSWTAGEFLLQCLKRLLLLLLIWSWCLHSCFSYFLNPLSNLLHSIFDQLFKIWYHRGTTNIDNGLSLPGVGPAWSQLELTLPDIGAAPSLFSLFVEVPPASFLPPKFWHGNLIKILKAYTVKLYNTQSLQIQLFRTESIHCRIWLIPS